MRPHFSAPHALLFVAAFLTAPVFAQVGTAASVPASGEEPVTLSPFEVSADKDVGYAASSSLAGSRLNSELKNTPAAITVFTREFLNDIGALNTEAALAYSLNAGREYTDYTGLASVQQGDMAVKSRGFVGASLGRDYFGVNVNLDSFNIERIDFSRGPNSILFGVGGPGGIINTSSKRARLGKSTEQLQVRRGSWDDTRATVDVNRQLGQKLAVRVNGVWQDRESWREFEFLTLKGAAAAATWRPFRFTELRVEGEYVDRKQLNAMPWPAADYSLTWINAGKPVFATAPTSGSATLGTVLNNARALVYDPLSGTGLRPWTGSLLTTKGPASPSQAGNPRTFTDFSILPRGSYLGGPANTSNNWYDVMSAYLEQRVGNLVVQLAYNRQESHRYADFGASWNAIGAYGDPNGLLPTATLPNGTLPTGAGQANPNAGKFFIDTTTGDRLQQNTSETWRATAAYELDLSRRHLGRHIFSGLASHEAGWGFTDAKQEVIINPPGTTLYPRDITSANNRVSRRTYLDFSSADPRKRGAHNYHEFPIENLNGLSTGLRRVANTAGESETITDSEMVAGQSQFWAGRIVGTWGLRRDTQEIFQAGNPTRDPVTNEFLVQQARVVTSKKSGDTQTFGAVLRPLPWLGLVYNRANNFVPQGQVDMKNQAIGTRNGRGWDLGVKLGLWEGKANVSLSRYQLSEINRFSNDARITTGLTPVANKIWEAMNQLEKQINSAARDSVDNAGEGWELEVTANPSRNWRLMANVYQADVVQSNTSPRWGAYIEENRALWMKNSTVPLLPPYNGIGNNINPTVADALATLDTNLAGLRMANGQAPRQHQRYGANAFAAYTLRKSQAWYDSLTIGGGFNYRSKPITGYDTTRNLAPVYGGESLIGNAMLQKSWRLKRSGSLQVQLNLDNVFNNQDLIITDKDNTGTYRYLFQQPRRWGLMVTYSH